MSFPSKKNKINQTMLQTMISYWTGKKNPSWWPSLFLTFDKGCISLIWVISLVCSCFWHMVSVICWQGYPAILCMPTLPQASSPLLVSTAQTSHKFHGTYHRRLIRKCLRNDWTHLVSLWTILRFDVSSKCFTTPSQRD